MSTRRNFFGEALAVGGWLEFLGSATKVSACLSPAPGSSASEPEALTESADSEFWAHFFDSVDPTVPVTRGRVHPPKLPKEERKVNFLHFNAGGLRYAEDIKDDELMDYPGDVQVNMFLGQFHPSAGIGGDWQAVRRAKVSRLRVDCVQTKPYMNLLAPLAWCAIASLKLDAAAKPSVPQLLGFNSPNALSGVTKILLPDGRGKVAVNIYASEPAPALEKAAKYVLKAAELAVPVLNFPAISVPAIKVFSLLYTDLEERASWIMNSELRDVVATKQALADPDLPPKHLRLIPGYYVLVPQAHIEKLKPSLANTEIQDDGSLVQRNPPTTDTPPDQRGPKWIPEVTYATLKISVTPATGSPNSGQNASAPGDSGFGSQTKGKGAPCTEAKKQ